MDKTTNLTVDESEIKIERRKFTDNTSVLYSGFNLVTK